MTNTFVPRYDKTHTTVKSHQSNMQHRHIVASVVHLNETWTCFNMSNLDFALSSRVSTS